MRNADIAEAVGKSEATTSTHLKKMEEAGIVRRFDYLYVHVDTLEQMTLEQLSRLQSHLFDVGQGCHGLKCRIERKIEARKEFLRHGGKESLSEQEFREAEKEISELQARKKHYETRRERAMAANYWLIEFANSRKSKESGESVPLNSINAEPIAV